MGITVNSNFDEEALLTIKKKRNNLAHGDVLFSVSCNDKSIEDMEILSDCVKGYLLNVVNAYENGINGLLNSNQ